MGYKYFNQYKFYLDKQTGYWISTCIPRKRMHIVVWEFSNGKIPNNYHIHHKDGDKSNNDITNLELISASDHRKIHITEESRERARALIKQISYLSKNWHSSEEGIKWHKEHGHQGWVNRKSINVICEHCKKEFLTKTYHSRFCSSNCKSAWRREMGLDDIDSECLLCKKIYRKNKYDKTRFCSMSCAAKFRWNKRGSEER